MSPSSQGGWHPFLAGLLTPKPPHTPTCSPAAGGPAAAVDVQAVVEAQVPKTWRPTMSAAAHNRAVGRVADMGTTEAPRPPTSKARPPSLRPTFRLSTRSARSRERSQAGERKRTPRTAAATLAGAASHELQPRWADPAWVERAGRACASCSDDDLPTRRGHRSTTATTPDPLVIHWICGPAPPGFPGRQISSNRA